MALGTVDLEDWLVVSGADPWEVRLVPGVTDDCVLILIDWEDVPRECEETLLARDAVPGEVDLVIVIPADSVLVLPDFGDMFVADVV